MFGQPARRCISRRESELREESIEIESGASHPPAGEASVSDAKRLYRRVGRG
jgi:hypothetical protein